MRKKLVRICWGLLVLLIAGTAIGFIAIDKGWIGYMPDMNSLQNPIDRNASTLYSADGKKIGTWTHEDNRQNVPYDSISQHVMHALVATEDVRFYEHTGIDLRAFGRAVIKRGLLGQKNAGGGSTITQQLAKQLYSKQAHGTLERLLQKPIEWVIAVELERNFTKEEILTLYLNYFDFLHNARGIKSAARVYFNKRPIDLNINEAALLVGMCKNPAYYNPLRNPERCIQRRNVVLEQMEKAGYLRSSEMASLQARDLNLDFHRTNAQRESVMPYLQEYLRQTMMAKEPDPSTYASWDKQRYYEDSLAWADNPLYGWCEKNRKPNGQNYNLYGDGLRVYTTVDSRMQRYAEESVLEQLKALQPVFNAQKNSSSTYPYIGISKRLANRIVDRQIKRSHRYRLLEEAHASREEIIRAFCTPVEMEVFAYGGDKSVKMSPLDSILYYKSFLRSTLASVDPTTGYVKAYVGGIDYEYFPFDLAMKGRRQIGSTMKPFVYAMAMEDGFTPDYTGYPKNYSFRKYGWNLKSGGAGMLGAPLRSGLAASNNWITANIMLQVDRSGRRLEKMLHEVGIANRDVQPSLVLCLGTCDITAMELASAYSIFATGGMYSAPIIVSRIEDNQGNVVVDFTPRQRQVINPLSAKYMDEMLAGVVRHGTGRRALGYVSITGDVGGKTGTTNNNSDAWFVGVVPRLITACWVGGEDRDIHLISGMGQGARAALPIWGKYMKRVYSDPSLGYSPSDKFPEYDPDDELSNDVYNDYATLPPERRVEKKQQEEVPQESGEALEPSTTAVESEETHRAGTGDNPEEQLFE